MTATLTQLAFLDAAACADLVDLAADNRHLAVDRRADNPGQFVTYGRVAYLDVCLAGADPERDYYQPLPESNTALWKVFQDFYHRLRERLTAELGGPVEYRPDILALPGLHIFRDGAIALADQASAHFDLQYRSLRLPAPPDPDRPPVTVTVPVRIPTHGTGLIVHDVDLGRFESAYRRGTTPDIESYARRRVTAFHRYQLGSLVLHRGLLMHRLSSPGPVLPGDERITVQGHAISCRGTWILYW